MCQSQISTSTLKNNNQVDASRKKQKQVWLHVKPKATEPTPPPPPHDLLDPDLKFSNQKPSQKSLLKEISVSLTYQRTSCFASMYFVLTV